jgi:hypothetical protein
MTNEDLMRHLANWADYMKQPTHKLGYPSQSLCMNGGGGSSDDEFEILCDEVDTRCAKIMDGIIDSISMPQRVAVNHVWLHVNHFYPTQDLDYEEALERINRLADKRGLL